MRRGFVQVTAAAAALALGACGGGGERQDADEPAGEYRLEVVNAKFPPEQAIAERATLQLEVRNADSKAVPNVAVTIETQPEQAGGAPGAFAQNRDDQGLADPSRPVWILDRGPEGGETAYTNTWALGRMEPGQTKKFEWRVTAVKAGDYQVGYTVAPGLDGKAKLASGTEARGSFLVTVDDEPADARIAEDGETVVREDSDGS
jgi:hypothetical protein